ncbi:type II secretion system major pseudopilin GspG [Indioceanicola profundi]|uniref:type II secretion system major pseudopilin GspG n=1 Tax=Indioceanicola profundi TaxID=2220096 RepID=UPI000E6AAF74|nr:type II secretion system major pseudopilin GspG [Indioceanicola profundi]
MNRRNQKQAKGRPGFTLLEALVCLVILGLIYAVTSPTLGKMLGGAKSDAASLQVQNLASTLELYRLDVGSFPNQSEGLRALVERPQDAVRWNGPYIRKAENLVDPWGRPYQYRYPGATQEVEVFSLGADNAAGGEGEARDVTSW